jgi:hypothetical protein
MPTNGTWCTLHESEDAWHWTTDLVGLIPAPVRPDGTWESLRDPQPQDRACVAAQRIEPGRVVDWPVQS